MRKYLFVTAGRRQGVSFPIKTAAYQLIGTMVLNVGKARHEMELSEAEFLRYAPEIAWLCQRPETAIYPVEIREEGMTAAEKKLAKTMAKKQEITDEFHGIPFFSLKKMAKDLGVDVKIFKGAVEMKKAIIYARHLKSLEVDNAGVLAA